jgi:hypothetical protein
VKKSIAGRFFELRNGFCVDFVRIPVGIFNVALGRFQFAWWFVLKGVSSADIFAETVKVDRVFVLSL